MAPHTPRAAFRRGLAALALLALLGLMAPVAHAQCPLTDLNCENVVTTTALAAVSTGCSIDGLTAFDAVQGTIDLAIPPYGYSLLPSDHAGVTLRDLFTVHGPADGAPYTLHLRVHGTGDAYSYGGPGDTDGILLTLSATIPQPGDPTSSRGWGTFSGFYVFDDSLDLVLQRTGGTPVGITIDAQASGTPGVAEGHLAYRFVDLPPGWGVTSCKGYVQEQPVPAIPATWGKVKAAYR